MIAGLFVLCWLALFSRNFLLIGFAYLTTACLFFQPPFDRILTRKILLVKLCLPHAYVAVFAFFPNQRSGLQSTLIVIGFAILSYFFFYRCQGEIERCLDTSSAEKPTGDEE
jgi:hypothetical protein